MTQPRIPPPLIGLGCLALMWGTNRLWPDLSVDFVGRSAIALTVLLIAIVIDISAIIAFRRARTTINPLAPETAATIVSGGPFRFSRNPMYLGMLMILVAWAIWLGNPINVLWPITFVAVITKFQIIPEEIALSGKFGAPYREYQTRVRRWL